MIVRDFIENYVKGTLGRKTICGCWSIINWGHMDVLQYTPSDKPDEHERIAYRLQDGSVLSNANQLTYVGRTFAWGSERSRWGRTEEPEQEWLQRAGAVPLPFTLFDEVPEMDVRDFEWIFKPTAERIKEIIPPAYNGDQPKTRIRHFSGACIFAIGKDTYLFDIDRQEIGQHGIFNAFLTKLPKRVSTIQEAYDILIPDEVREANENDVEVKRQGEFFFIKHSDECPVKSDLTDEEIRVLRHPPSRIGFGITPVSGRRMAFVSDDRAPFGDGERSGEAYILDTLEKQAFQKEALEYQRVLDKYNEVSAKPGVLGKSASGSHEVEKYLKVGEDVFASGVIKQNRRQHGDLVLNGWYKVVANTGTISWTITGDID
jgi:hypothetical protein